MLLVPYSSTAWMMFRRMPVRIEETTTTTSTPITTPKTVSPLRMRCEPQGVERHAQGVEGDAGARGSHQLRVRATTGSSFAARDAG